NMAAETFAGEPRVSFAVGDAVATRQAGAFFDLVIAHTVLPSATCGDREFRSGFEEWEETAGVNSRRTCLATLERIPSDLNRGFPKLLG
ncbi:MAG TPA: hypothetical protein VEN78_24930, partial [Bradyrhizobium sp.]|nr:hypothetical protein [Bradyrhizobium sp.]